MPAPRFFFLFFFLYQLAPFFFTSVLPRAHFILFRRSPFFFAPGAWAHPCLALFIPRAFYSSYLAGERGGPLFEIFSLSSFCRRLFYGRNLYFSGTVRCYSFFFFSFSFLFSRPSLDLSNRNLKASAATRAETRESYFIAALFCFRI